MNAAPDAPRPPGEAFLLQAKLTAPRPRHFTVHRTELMDRLEQDLKALPRVAAFIAPPGYGKTTVLADWLAAGEHPSAWLTLDRQDGDPSRFASYLHRALSSIIPSGAEAFSSVLQALGPPSPELLAALVIEAVQQAEKPSILVFDDYHSVQSGFLHEFMRNLMENAPPGLFLIVCARRDPPLPLPRLRAMDALTEVRAEDLSFTLEETGTLLARVADRELPHDTVQTIHNLTEGWPAAIQLAALSLRNRTLEQIQQYVMEFSGSDRYVIDYLMQEVLDNQSPDIRTFLTKTAALDRFCAELCDAVTDRGDSAQVLQELERQNLFIIPLGPKPKWYRYHHLFASFLKAVGDDAEQSAAARRAALWFEGQDQPIDAVNHMASSGDQADTARLLQRVAGRVFRQGQYATLLDWLNRLPSDAILRNPELGVYKAWALFLTEKIDTAAAVIDDLSKRPDIRKNKTAYTRLAGLRAWITGSAGTELAGRLLRGRHESRKVKEPFFYALTLFPLGRAQFRQGNLRAARRTFERAFAVSERIGNAFLSLCAVHSLAFILVEEGKLTRAYDLCRDALRGAADASGRPLPIAAPLLIAMAAIHYLRNELVPARQHAAEGRELCRQLSLAFFLVEAGDRTLILSEWALGERERALRILREARGREDPAQTKRFGKPLDTLQAHLELRRGNIAEARHWADRAFRPGGRWAADEEARLVRIRVLMAQGRNEKAEQLLTQLAGRCRAAGRGRTLLSAVLLLSLARMRRGRQAACREALVECLELGERENLRRPFLDEGEEIAALLPAAGAGREFVEALLADFAGERSGDAGGPEAEVPRQAAAGGPRAAAEGPAVGPAPLDASLSRREREVLALLAQGHSNADIGDRLFISVGTVKWHVNHIFAKLGVASRTQALRRAQDLGLV